MKKILKLAIFLVCFSGCKSIVKTTYGIKKPRLEDDRTVKEFLLRKKIDTSNVYVFKDILSFAKASDKNILSIPDAMFFNRKGYLVRYKKPAVECNAKVGEFISDLGDFSKIDADKLVTINDLLGLIKTTSGKPVQNADITVFITWTKYSGKLNKVKAFAWIQSLQEAKAKGINVNYYLLNCDYMKSWNIPKPLQDKLGIKN